MNETRNLLNTVIRQIEDVPDADPEEDLLEDPMLTTDQVMAILLGRRDKPASAVSAPNPAERLQPLARLDYYAPLPEGRSPLRKLSNFVKRVIRKLIRPILLPLTDAQNRFNAATVQAVDSLYQDLESLREEIRSLQKQINNTKNR